LFFFMFLCPTGAQMQILKNKILYIEAKNGPLISFFF